MIDHRNVYLKELIDGRKRKTADGKRGRRVKICIAKNVEKRHKQIDAGLPGHLVSISKYRLAFSHKTEQALHRRYKRYHTPVKNLKPGAGGSEIYTISTSQLAFLRLTLGAFVAADVFISFTLVAIISKLIYLICYLLQ